LIKSIVKSIINFFGYSIHKVPKVKTVISEIFVRKRFEPYETNFLGHTLFIHDHDSYLLGEQELFLAGNNMYKFSAKTDQPYIIDCGANLGMSIIYFKTLYPNSKITAFEADPQIFSFLEKNVQSFNLSNVTLINKAVWNSNGNVLPFLSEGGAGGRIEARKMDIKFCDVESIRLRDFLNKEVDFLKIDIEGAEFEVMYDCADLLCNVKNLFVEYHSFENSEQKLHTILAIIKSAGFKYHVKEAFTSPEPFIKQHVNFGMDLQLNIFCYRTI
jgi:FkbM family methyltransferase